LFPVFHLPCSTAGPCTLLNIFLSHVPCLFKPTSVIVLVSHPYTTNGFHYAPWCTRIDQWYLFEDYHLQIMEVKWMWCTQQF
jgi:hypothetical protein